VGKWVQPTAGGGDPKGRGTRWVDTDLAIAYPALTGWLGDGWEEDGTARETGTLLIFAEGDVVKACLSDRQSGLRCFLTAKTFQELLLAAEETLYSGEGDWRGSREKTPHRKS